VKLGLDVLFRETGRRVAILGKMAELGEMSHHYHKEIGIYAREKTDVLIAVGEDAKHFQADHWFATTSDCIANLQAIIQPKDVILIKGSASAGLKVIVQAFERQW